MKLAEFHRAPYFEFSKFMGQQWLEPYAYLRYLFAELPKAKTVEAIETLLPSAVMQDQIEIS